ncbi:MAG TPA: cytochrome c-type biogenesis protein [Alphaproteobacteria bacterium]|jgi:cytochrome c-type biogenesis protein CcmH|nr:cytochrome c-type biogenesis protein [Alphaproteobacteria bacterium]
MRALLAALVVLAAVLGAVPSHAVEPGEMLKDPALEARARAITKSLRCLVCQNQSIDDSNADLARDLRLLVRQRLSAGDSDREVVDYVVSRYGDFVLLKPPLNAETLLLWFGPALVLAGAAAGAWFYVRRRRSAAAASTAPLSEDERRRLAALVEDERP